MKKLRLILAACLIAYGLQICGSLFYSRNVLVAAQDDVKLYHKKQLSPFSYFPLFGLVFTYLHKYNAFTISHNYQTVIYEYEAFERHHIDFSSFKIEKQNFGYTIYCDTLYKEQELFLKLEAHGLNCL